MIKKFKFLMIITFIINIAYAMPPLPTEFYGNITYYNGSAPLGTITAYDSDNVLCGTFNMVYEGKYGILTCKGDDTFTIIDEGATPNNKITFYYNGEEVSPIGDNTFTSSIFKNVTLVYPKIVCGDVFCSEPYEDCALCSSDCGACPIIPDINGTVPPTNGTGGDTGNETGTGGQTTTGGGSSGGGSGAGGSGSGSGGSSGGGSGGNGGNAYGGGSAFLNISCEEKWNCSQWSICYLNETQYRTCVDLNNCTTTDKKPPEIQECIYAGNCFDEIQNGAEEGIDCGGPCNPCEETITNATCFDNLKNQAEEGIDCGGPCEKECPIKKPIVELPMHICKRKLDFHNPIYWVFLFAVIIAICFNLYYSSKIINHTRNNRKLSDLEKSKKIVYVKRNMHLFNIILPFMTLLLMAYYYFFSQCSSYLTDFLWLLVAIFIIIPFIGFYVLKYLEYDEDEKIKKLELFFEQHQKTIKDIKTIKNKYIMEIENEIAEQIHKINNNEIFKVMLDKYPELKEIYKEMLYLYHQYKNNKNPFAIEKELCNNIYNIVNNENFKNLAKQYTNIKTLYDNIVLLYKQYEEKEKMYNDIFNKETKKIENNNPKTNESDEDNNDNNNGDKEKNQTENKEDEDDEEDKQNNNKITNKENV